MRVFSFLEVQFSNAGFDFELDVSLFTKSPCIEIRQNRQHCLCNKTLISSKQHKYVNTLIQDQKN